MYSASQSASGETGALSRLRVTVRGAVQGVGFRPSVYRLATELGLSGWVGNSAQGVLIEVEGETSTLNSFLLRLEREKPPRAFIQSLESSFLDPKGYPGFEIRPSEDGGAKTALVLPDIATCPECLREILDPHNRRHGYPFTNCTNCGPRFSFIEALPYDRAHTTMKQFVMCHECAAEYHNPLDRRFHAQPNACPVCGPHLELWNRDGHLLARFDLALTIAAASIHQGQIVAVKGLGGFHLMVDARNDEAVRELRKRKHREERPFALMYPSLEQARMACEVSALEERLLLSPEAPIVLLKRRAHTALSAQLAPGNPYLGVMLPYTPLHHLLMNKLQFPVVATSGNLSDEPICVDEHDAFERLQAIADVFLIHNRPIKRHVDDSIVRVVAGREMVLRRARGYAPLPVHVQERLPAMLAAGAHLKNTIALSSGHEVFVSQHIGDLETTQAFDAFQRVIRDFEQLYEVQPAVIACDAHPDYLSTKYAERTNIPVRRIQHHYAHIVSCMAENEVTGTALGVAWDGTGFGLDGTIWGGEFLRVDERAFTRIAHFRTFCLPGGEKAVKEPRRIAVGLLYEIFGDQVLEFADLAPLRSFTERERAVLLQMLRQRVSAPRTSSAGRLFDAVAALVGLRVQTRFEGQAAMDLEFAINDFATAECYPVTLSETHSPLVIDWEPMIRALIGDLRAGVATAELAAKFHNTLIESIVLAARHCGEPQIVLSGGCFQNKYLTERAVSRLRAEGFRPYWHQRIPTNDGGIAPGQLIAAARLAGETTRAERY